ncbi:helix-turn-helix domain-containing protein [Eubacterium callanderi]|uniref:helix-turn-helix domain-containing protein n=1 Tax=Eubacterium callanderi TaxID=53442 RepID=UPI0039921CCF
MKTCASRLNEIATKTGLETSGTSNLLSSLIDLGIVKKEIPITETRSKKHSTGLKTVCSFLGIVL